MVLCNDYLADNFEPYTQPRLAGDDSRLRRPRLVDRRDGADAARGSHAYFVWATPFEGRSPAHPAADRFWRASTDLGMIGVLHIGNTPAHFDGGWADAGWDEPDGAGMSGLLRFANSQRTQGAQTFLAALLFGGTFTRNPGVTIVLAELWASWLPWFVSRLEMLGDANGALGRVAARAARPVRSRGTT